ncbi:hypothetical protein, partial [Pseudomonas syringae group genomosp. 7]|uniref:hypothetical protein n=1 Tax=Pseudomonas syringae group genomosp. 7 TaxID=251699 RepID=UPI00376F7463
NTVGQITILWRNPERTYKEAVHPTNVLQDRMQALSENAVGTFPQPFQVRQTANLPMTIP